MWENVKTRTQGVESMSISLEFFYKIQPEVKTAYTESIGEGRRNSALEGLFNLLFHN